MSSRERDRRVARLRIDHEHGRLRGQTRERARQGARFIFGENDEGDVEDYGCEANDEAGTPPATACSPARASAAPTKSR